MKRKLKKSTMQYIIVAALCFLVIGGTGIAAYILSVKQIKAKYEAQVAMAQEELDDNKREVYVVSEELKAGDYLTETNTIYKTVFATQAQETYLTKDDLGKVLLIDVQPETQLLKSMVTENVIDTDLREVCYELITVNSNIVHNDTVDIRILYPNGENFVVLSKKNIKHQSESIYENYFWLSEEEIIRMSSAIVDAFLYNGTILYTTKYIEPNIQEASEVTYTPSLATLELIKNNPNIVDTASAYLNAMVRKELENRLAASTKLEVGEIDWKINNTITNETNSNDVTTDKDGFVYFTEEEKDKESDQEYGE